MNCQQCGSEKYYISSVDRYNTVRVCLDCGAEKHAPGAATVERRDIESYRALVRQAEKDMADESLSLEQRTIAQYAAQAFKQKLFELEGTCPSKKKK